MENIFNNDVKVLGVVSASTLSSPTLETKVEREELDLFADKQYVDDAMTIIVTAVNQKWMEAY